MFVLLLAVLVGLLSNINAVPTVVSDYRIQDPNLTPALGRGYSLTTNQVLSTCLQFKEKTEPTYNYDYDYLDIKHDGKTDEKKSGKFQASLSWGFVSASVTGSFSSESHEEVHTHNIVTRMAMERYYSSVDDTTSSLTKDAVDLIKKGDLLGFYQACGSGYIRSIRRVAEVAAVFTYESKSLDSVTKAAASLQIKLFGRGAGGGSFEMESTSHSSDTKLKIQIKAFGLGLNGNGSQTLVATSLEDYQGAIQYAFKSMQNDDVGMVRGIEVLPWVDSLQFQNQVEFTDLEVVGTEPSANQVVPADYKPKIVSSVEVKAISTINAEFISSIEATYRAQLYYIATMTKCVGDLELMKRNPANNGKFLVDHSKMDFMPSKNKFTVAEVSAVINVDKLKEKYNSVVKFVNGFYGPCATAIMRASNRGRMTKYFWEFTNECKPECLLPNYKVDVAVDTAGVRTITCTPPSALDATRAAQVGDYSVDEVIHRFCMPEFDYDIRNPIQDITTPTPSPTPSSR